MQKLIQNRHLFCQHEPKKHFVRSAFLFLFEQWASKPHLVGYFYTKSVKVRTCPCYFGGVCNAVGGVSVTAEHGDSTEACRLLPELMPRVGAAGRHTEKIVFDRHTVAHRLGYDAVDLAYVKRLIVARIIYQIGVRNVADAAGIDRGDDAVGICFELFPVGACLGRGGRALLCRKMLTENEVIYRIVAPEGKRLLPQVGLILGLKADQYVDPILIFFTHV